MGEFEFDVMAQHRGELLGRHLAVVAPGRFVLVVLVGGAGIGRLAGVALCWGLLGGPLAGARGGIGPEFGIAQFTWILNGIPVGIRIGGPWRRFRLAEQAALQGLIRGASRRPGHGPGGAALIVPSPPVAFRV